MDSKVVHTLQAASIVKKTSWFEDNDLTMPSDFDQNLQPAYLYSDEYPKLDQPLDTFDANSVNSKDVYIIPGVVVKPSSKPSRYSKTKPANYQNNGDCFLS